MDAMRDEVCRVLAGINDPEMPISIVDLGIVDDVQVDSGRVTVRILPTFVGCPALDMLKDEIVCKTSVLPGVSRVEVSVAFDPPWTTDRITPAGRENLRRIGITVPEHAGGDGSGVRRHSAVKTQESGVRTRDSELVQLGLPERLACPYCGSTTTSLQSAFGPTRCRMIWYCSACKNQFEHMKRVGGGAER